MKNKTNKKDSKLSITKRVIKNYSGSKNISGDFNTTISMCQSVNSSTIF